MGIEEDKKLLQEMFRSMKAIYPKVKSKIEHLEKLVINNYDKAEIEALRDNILAALKILRSADERELAVAKKSKLKDIVDLTLKEIDAIDKLVEDIEVFVKEPNPKLRTAIEKITAHLGDLLAKEGKKLPK